MSDKETHERGNANQRQDEWSNLLVKVGRERCNDAFAKLFAHFAPLVKGFCVANANSGVPAEFADELVQDVMLKVWSKAPSFDPHKAAANTWVYTIMRNSRIDLVRRNSRHIQATEPLEVEDVWDESLDNQPFVRLLHSRDKEVIQQSFKQLPTEQRDALQQVYMHGKSHSEIAEESGLPLGTVKSRIRMGLKKLQAHLGQNRLEP